MELKNLLEIKLKTDKAVIIESLCRMGIANKDKKIIYPSVYLYEKDGNFYLAHFKQLFSLIRKDAYNNITEDDLERRNAIAFCLKKWGLIDISEEVITPHNMFVFVLPYQEKKNWQIFHKFNRNMIT